LTVSPLALAALTFLAVVLATLAVYSILIDLFLRDRTRFNKRVDDEFHKRQREHIQTSALFKDLATLQAEGWTDEERRTCSIETVRPWDSSRPSSLLASSSCPARAGRCPSRSVWRPW